MRYSIINMNTVKDLFATKKIKATAQRMLVYKALYTLGHATVDQVVGEVRRSMPTVAVATVYNILEVLCENSVISRLYTDDNRLYYDVTSENHHHIFCEHRIVDLKDTQLTGLIMDHLREHEIEGFTPLSIRLQVIGTLNN